MRSSATRYHHRSQRANSERPEDVSPRDLVLQPAVHGVGRNQKVTNADEVKTCVCGYCATGCGLRLHLKDGEAVALTPEEQYPVNFGLACPKGWEAIHVLSADDRATHPLVKQPDGSMAAVDWNQALELFVERFRTIQQRHGDHSIAFLSSGQITCEEMAYLGSLAKFGLGLRHGDSNTRQCMASAVTAYQQAFGFDAPPYTYEDLEQSDCLVFIGANPCINHPILWERVLRNRRSPEIIVIDPRRTETAAAASQHLALNPKADLAVIYAITQHVIACDFVDEQFVANHTIGFERLREHVSYYKADDVAEAAGLSAESIREAARAIGSRQAASFWWTMGVNQSHQGTRTAQAIINLALITGNIGRPGTGANSITGQCNAMGARLWSNTSTLLGHHHFEDPIHRRKVAAALQIDEEQIPADQGWSYEQIIQGIHRGDVRGLWVIGTNPAHSWIKQGELRQLLDKLDFLVVQDIYHSTETARHADLFLPAAGWGEKTGTFINSERRYGLVEQVKAPPGQALADFEIFRRIAKHWGLGEMFCEWTDPEAVFRIMQRTSSGQLCDITGISGYDHIAAERGIQWPWSEAEGKGGFRPEPQRRLFSDGHFNFQDGLARMVIDDFEPHPEPPCDTYPLTLITGRGAISQWHTQTRTSKSALLRTLYTAEPYLEIHPSDAASRRIRDGELVLVRSRHGEARAVARLTEQIGEGQVFMPMHYEQANRLTSGNFDPHSQQPSYKDSAVDVSRAASS